MAKLRMDDRNIKPFLRLNPKRFNSPSGIRFWLLATVLKLALRAGYPVLVLGRCRTGKSLLLNKITPGNVIDKRNEAMESSSRLVSLSVEDLPVGRFSIDECQLIDPSSLSLLMIDFGKRGLVFSLAAQRYADVQGAMDAYRSEETASRVILVVLGGKTYPERDLDATLPLRNKFSIRNHS